jgi:holo-[acyl-carrier protein] synthase
MIVGIGVDVTSLERIRGLGEKHGERFLRRIYTEVEREYCGAYRDPTPHLAARFAAKEATYKALGGVGPIRWVEMEVRNDDRGKPLLFFYGTTEEIAKEAGVTRGHLTLAHDAGVAIAQVVLEGESPDSEKG